jgi:hypothetical protein
MNIKKLLSATLLIVFFVGSMLYSYNVFAATSGGPTGTPTFENPIDYDDVEGVLSNVLDTIRGIVGILAVVMIVVGGILYITSGGDSGRIGIAKAAITAAIIGLAVAVAAPTFLFEIYNVLGGTTPAAAQGAKTLSAIALDVLKVLLGIVGTLSVLMLVVGGILYITAGGSDRADTAKKTIQYAIIGLIVAILSLVIVTQVARIF